MMTKTEKINEIVEGLEKDTDFGIMREIKEILNKTFGEENNQIIKPNYFTIKKLAQEQGILSHFMETARSANTEGLQSWLTRYFPNTLCYQVVIKFPELEITNGVDKHIIKDLYVRFFLRPDGSMKSGIDGVRGKLSIAEVRSTYAHSHLPYCNPRDMMFQSFCTGVGPINQVMMLLSTKFSVINFKMFCFHLKVYVVWESKEGKPHMYIENIHKQNSHTEFQLGAGTAVDAALQLLEDLRACDAETILSFLNYDVLPTRIEVSANDNFEKWACEKIMNWDLNSIWAGYNIERECFLNTKDNSGKYYSIPRNTVPEELFDSDKVLLQFKGEDIKLQVELSKTVDEQTIKNEEKVPNPNITRYIGEKLSSQLSKTAFSNARVRNCSAGTGKPEASRSDPFSLQRGLE